MTPPKSLSQNLCILITSKEEEEAVLKEFEKRDDTWHPNDALVLKGKGVLIYEQTQGFIPTHTASAFLSEYGEQTYVEGQWYYESSFGYTRIAKYSHVGDRNSRFGYSEMYVIDHNRNCVSEFYNDEANIDPIPATPDQIQTILSRVAEWKGLKRGCNFWPVKQSTPPVVSEAVGLCTHIGSVDYFPEEDILADSGGNLYIQGVWATIVEKEEKSNFEKAIESVADQLPEKWAILRTPENAEMVNGYVNEKFNCGEARAEEYYMCVHPRDYMVLAELPEDYTLITDEQFKRIAGIKEEVKEIETEEHDCMQPYCLLTCRSENKYCPFLPENKKVEEKPIDKVTTTMLDCALRMCGYNIEPKVLDNIMDVVELLEEKGGQTSIEDICVLQAQWEIHSNSERSRIEKEAGK